MERFDKSQLSEVELDMYGDRGVMKKVLHVTAATETIDNVRANTSINNGLLAGLTREEADAKYPKIENYVEINL